MKHHPAADAFPMMDTERYRELLADIREHGQREVITVCDGMVLDGRNRYKACGELGIEPRTRTFDGDPWAYAWSLNGQRRDLVNDQRYLIWKFCEEHSTEWQATKAAIQAEANRKRSEAAREQPRTETGFAEKQVRGHFVPGPDNTPRPGKAAKAAASNTNAGAVARGDKLAKHRPDLAEKVRMGEMKPAHAIREMKRAEVVAELENIEAKEAKAAAGVYDVIVIDPPWPMEKIERDVAPEQVAFGYPTLDVFCQNPGCADGLDENDYIDCVTRRDEWETPGKETCERSKQCNSVECIVGEILHRNTAANAHIWVWSTHKYLPDTYRLLTERWDLKYVCLFVWHKPGGFQPYGLPQYNCEFALYARKGTPQFIDTKAFPVCFDAPRGAHSEKPGLFYDVVRRVTAGRRLDVFNRRKLDGFDGWGKEAQ